MNKGKGKKTKSSHRSRDDNGRYLPTQPGSLQSDQQRQDSQASSLEASVMQDPTALESGPQYIIIPKDNSPEPPGSSSPGSAEDATNWEAPVYRPSRGPDEPTGWLHMESQGTATDQMSRESGEKGKDIPTEVTKQGGWDNMIREQCTGGAGPPGSEEDGGYWESWREKESNRDWKKSVSKMSD